MTRPERHRDPDTLAARIVEETGGDIRLVLPLGVGKAIHVGNALFRRAVEDRSIRLRIFTARRRRSGATSPSTTPRLPPVPAPGTTPDRRTPI